VIGLSKKVVVIGGGAAGMMAAGTAAGRGLNVTLIEKNNRLGKKLLITGKGRCNITNNADIEDFIQNVPVNGSFLYSAFYTFPNTSLIELLNQLGLKTKVERGGRVFPESDKASDVVKTLEKYMKQSKVNIVHGEVVQIKTHHKKVTGVVLKTGQEIAADSIIVATGGMSYPETGSTGDGYRFARQLGHTVTELKPSLVSLETKEDWVKKLQGLSLKNVQVCLYNSHHKKIFSDFGEMLFTHYGVSGPIILSASSHIRNLQNEDYYLVIDLKPALSNEQLDKRIQRDFEKYSRKYYINALDDLLPKKLIPVVVELSGIAYDKPVNQITKAERLGIVELLKNLSLHIKGFRPLKEAIVTSGGVHVDEINPATMESKLIEGLYFAGEVIDVDAYTGGFNLQIAFSTGYLAGLNC